jgi:hypothetical protein
VTERTKAVLAMDPLTPFTNFVDAFDHWAKVGRDPAVAAVFGCVLKGGFRENGENGDYASKLVAYFQTKTHILVAVINLYTLFSAMTKNLVPSLLLDIFGFSVDGLKGSPSHCLSQFSQVFGP